ncbi:MAG: LysR family transcriptional regulator [Panacagrimonas sp.]|nr:LysR family transcriptional regulator [Panacagrimonas sp.]MCC2654946.1 LysR family transcriptional regulator [Panacagrimonas sp.]
MITPIPRTSLDQWAIFAAVVDQGGYAQAAEALHKSQSAISYAVSRLQDALELPLLVVAGRKAVLTEHGRTLLARVRPLLRDLQALEAQARLLKQGWEPELALVVDLAFPRERLLQVVAELQQLCPSTQVRLADAVLSGAEEAISESLADVVVTAHVPAGFLGDHLLDVEFIAVATPSHPLFAMPGPLETTQLERYTQVVVRDSGTRRPRDEGWLGANRRFTVSSMEASLSTVRAGLGYAWLPAHMTREDLRSGALRALPLAHGGSRNVPLYLVLVKAELAGPAARTALECFQRHVPVSRRDADPGAPADNP